MLKMLTKYAFFIIVKPRKFVSKSFFLMKLYQFSQNISARHCRPGSFQHEAKIQATSLVMKK